MDKPFNCASTNRADFIILMWSIYIWNKCIGTSVVDESEEWSSSFSNLSNWKEAWKKIHDWFFFIHLLSQFLNLKIYCDDHSSLLLYWIIRPCPPYPEICENAIIVTNTACAQPYPAYFPALSGNFWKRYEYVWTVVSGNLRIRLRHSLGSSLHGEHCKQTWRTARL